MASGLALVLLSVLFVSAYPEECPDLVALPSPYADSSFSGTVRKTVDERTYGIEINDIHYGADIHAAPSSCWTSHEGLQLLLIELDSKSTRCRLTLTVGRTYIFSVHASQTSCPTLFQDGVYSPVLLPTHLTAERDRVVRQTAEARIPYPDNEVLRECCVQSGVTIGITGMPAARAECLTIQGNEQCGVVGRECCECCKLGRLIRRVIGIDECPQRAILATFGECRPIFLACCRNTTGMFCS